LNSSKNHLDLTLVELYPTSGPRSLAQHLQQVEAQLAAMDASTQLDPDAGCAHFPVVLLSYSDLLEACDSMQYLATRRLDAVLVFAPQFVIGEFKSVLLTAVRDCCVHRVARRGDQDCAQQVVSTQHYGRSAHATKTAQATGQLRVSPRFEERTELFADGRRCGSGRDGQQ
jgi:hypothetical protein